MKDIGYWFSVDVAKKLGKSRFLQKHKKTFPHLDVEAIWNEMFPPEQEKTKEN